MRVDIWSDIVCPFCYIGKRRFENALAASGEGGEVEVVWHSFQLDPEAQYEEGVSLNDYLAKRKGFPVQRAAEMNKYVTDMAAELGLNYQLDNAKIANTYNAHRLLHLAQEYNVQNEVKEALMIAYFTNGEVVSDNETLVSIGTKHGIPTEKIEEMLAGNGFAGNVHADIEDARQLGIQGVPFFVFNGKYAVSGAQSCETFADVIAKVAAEEKPLKVIASDGDSCDIDGNCA